MTKTTKKMVHEGPYVAEVELDLADGPWSPTLTLADAERLDEVRIALRNGDVRTAARYGQVFHLSPVRA